MRVVILDAIETNEDLNAYRELGYEIYSHHYKVKGDADIVSNLWSYLPVKWFQDHNVSAVACRDFDEPDNVLPTEDLEKFGIELALVDDWGHERRVEYHLSHIAHKSPSDGAVLLVSGGVTFDLLEDVLKTKGYTVYRSEPVHMAAASLIKECSTVDCHIGKRELPRFFLDGLLPHMRHGTTVISTTRGPLYRAEVFRKALDLGIVDKAILDWQWGKLSHPNLVDTKHTSYKSPLSRKQLTEVTIDAVNRLAAVFA